MRVEFEAGGGAGRPLRPTMVARVRFAMRRMAWMVEGASVRVARLEVPHGPDKRCEVEVIPRGGRPVSVTAVARNWHEALDAALRRVARILNNLLRRRHAHRPVHRALLTHRR